MYLPKSNIGKSTNIRYRDTDTRKAQILGEVGAGQGNGNDLEGLIG